MTAKQPLLDDPAISGDALVGDGETIRMLHDLMLVRRWQGDTTAAEGRLHVPEKYREASCHGVVIAVGLGLKKCNDWSSDVVSDEREPMEIREGDVVMYDGSTGINSREYRKGSGIIIVAQRDVLFIAREECLTQHRLKTRWSPSDELVEEPFNPDDYEPGGVFFEKGCDDAGYFPVGKHLPKYMRDELEAAARDGHTVEIVREGKPQW